MMEMFRYLHYGLSLVLVFVGAKMLLSHYLEIPTPVAPGGGGRSPRHLRNRLRGQPKKKRHVGASAPLVQRCQVLSASIRLRYDENA
jgi:hypothetical protein